MPRWRALSASPVVWLVVVVAASQVMAVAQAPDHTGVTAVVLVVLDLLGFGYSLAAARRSRDRMAWQLVAASRLLSIVANGFLGAAHLGVAYATVWWWVGVAAGLGMYVSLAAGALAFPARHLRGRHRSALVTEAVAVLGGGFMFVWFFVLDPILRSQAGSLQWVLSIGFPLGDLLLLIAVAVTVLRGGFAASRRQLTLLATGIVVYLTADTVFSAVGDDGNHTTGPLPATLLVVTASLFMTVAAMLTDERRRSDTGSDPTPAVGADPTSGWYAYFPYLVVAAGFGLTIMVTIEEHDFLPWGGLVLGLIVMTGAVAVRQLISLRDSRDRSVTDPLTGLANRVRLYDAMDRMLRRREPVAVLLIDLDDFKLVNDAYGHAAGDTLLAEFGRILRINLRNTDVPARIGGDEFVVLLSDIASTEEAVAAAERILATAAVTPVRVGYDEVHIRGSIGIATSLPDDDIEALLRRADLAMYHTKHNDTANLTVYDPSIRDRRGDEAALGHDLESAIADGQLQVLYQPLVDIDNDRPRGFEALLRWYHPTRGLVSPLEFIPIAERTGAINAIGLHVLADACTRVLEWQKTQGDLSGPLGVQPLYASVNVAPRQLREPTIVADILAVLDKTGLPPTDLVLEITESAIVDDAAIPVLQTLRDRGVRIAIDDFGTGYSALHYLAQLPVDIVKIDRTFVSRLNGTAEGAAITEAIIRLASVLHLTTVAEGIETTGQAIELQLLGCHTGQGYLYSKPLPPDRLEAYLADVMSTPSEI